MIDFNELSNDDLVAEYNHIVDEINRRKGKYPNLAWNLERSTIKTEELRGEVSAACVKSDGASEKNQRTTELAGQFFDKTLTLDSIPGLFRELHYKSNALERRIKKLEESSR